MIETHVMWSIKQIATRDQISKQAVSKTVKTLIEQHGLPVNRDARGRVATVSLAHYDHLRLQYSNPAKASMPPLADEPDDLPLSAPASIVAREKDSFDEARRQAEWLKVDREKLRRQEELGQLVRKDLLSDALLFTGREIQNIVSRLTNNADDLALIVSKEGVHGLRNSLRDIAFKTNEEIADRLAAIVAGAPRHDALIDES